MQWADKKKDNGSGSNAEGDRRLKSCEAAHN